MLYAEERGPTYVLRKICEKIQAKTSELLASFKVTELQKKVVSQQKSDREDEQTRICVKSYLSQSYNIKLEQSFIEALKNDLCRIISAELPQVVNYEANMNEKVQDLAEEIEQCKAQLKVEKQNYKESILEKDKLKLQILQFEHQIKLLTDQIDDLRDKYNDSFGLVTKYIKDIQKLEDQNLSLKQSLNTQINGRPDQKQGFDKTLPAISVTSPKSIEREINLPMQIKQKLNEAQKVLNRSPRSGDLQLESSHFQLSSEIVGCQKELLEIELKNAQKQKVQLLLELEQERNYTQRLEKQVDNLQRLLEGEKRLNQKLDRELYTLINATKQMKLELLQERARNKQLQEEILELEQAAGQHHKQTAQLQNRITQLEVEQKKAVRLQDEAQELKNQLEISQKKYEQLRKIKHELEYKVEDCEEKLVQFQKNQSQEQVKLQSFQQALRSESSERVRQIEQMSAAIKAKYESKMELVQKQYREVREKCRFLKDQNARLYEAFDVQSKKETKLSKSYQQAKSKLQQSEQQLTQLQSDHQVLEQKWKTQILLTKELKRQLVNTQKTKLNLEKTLKRIHTSKLPALIDQIKLIHHQVIMIKSTTNTFQEQFSKLGEKMRLQIETKLSLTLREHNEKESVMQEELNKKSLLIEHWKRQAEDSQAEKIKLIQRLNAIETKCTLANQDLEQQKGTICQLQKKLGQCQCSKSKLQREVQDYKRIEKSGVEQIQILRAKQKQVEKFYDLVDQLTQENLNLKHKLQTALMHQHESPLSKQNNYFVGNNHSLPSYLIPQKQSRQKRPPKHQPLANSNSCAHLRPTSKNKNHSLTGVTDIPVSPSLQKQAYSRPLLHYDQTLPNQLPIHSRPFMFDSRKSHTHNQPFLTMASEEAIDFGQANFAEVKGNLASSKVNRLQDNFQDQRRRLQLIKNQYQKIMVDRFREDLIQRAATSQTHL